MCVSECVIKIFLTRVVAMDEKSLTIKTLRRITLLILLCYVKACQCNTVFFNSNVAAFLF